MRGAKTSVLINTISVSGAAAVIGYAFADPETPLRYLAVYFLAWLGLTCLLLYDAFDLKKHPQQAKPG